jgi:hypothetical protein
VRARAGARAPGGFYRLAAVSIIARAVLKYDAPRRKMYIVHQ